MTSPSSATPNGSLVFWAGSIAIHVFGVAFLERALALKDALPFHVARKKVPYVDEAGKLVEPKRAECAEVRAIHLRSAAACGESDRGRVCGSGGVRAAQERAGRRTDTPEYVHQFMLDQHRRWLEAAGTRVAEGVQWRSARCGRSMRKALARGRIDRQSIERADVSYRSEFHETRGSNRRKQR